MPFLNDSHCNDKEREVGVIAATRHGHSCPYGSLVDRRGAQRLRAVPIDSDYALSGVIVVSEFERWLESVVHRPKTYGRLVTTQQGETVWSNSERRIADRAIYLPQIGVQARILSEVVGEVWFFHRQFG